MNARTCTSVLHNTQTACLVSSLLFMMFRVVVCVSDCLILFQSGSICTSIVSSFSLPSFKFTCSSLSNTIWYSYTQSGSFNVSRSHLLLHSPLCLYKFDNFSLKILSLKTGQYHNLVISVF